ncbi:myo-inosose-2 dehydratase [Acetobacter pasteurianus]|uniref:myo-inosose-2 dehydratase n=1 Tax=Acetobacter pasteurianus TaxID=438 RepID=UPI003D12F768
MTMKAKLGIAPIAWWNDDLEELSDDVSLEECLRQASEAGFTGMETGRRFPMDMDELGPILKRYGISVCGGWFSGLLLDGDMEAEKDRIRAQMDFFIAARAPCIVYGETARSVQGVRSAPLATKPRLSEDDIRTYGRRMTTFAEWCADEGMPLAYHHHMAAPIETEAELDLLMKHSGKALHLLFDTGHMYFAGGNLLRVIDKHHARISHVHTKDVRKTVIDHLDRSKESFLDAIVKGAFTVPGDGSIDFLPIFERLSSYNYEGWFVVEAEQDPTLNPPLEMARKGHAALMQMMAQAEYSVAS